jgi:hypothetical protein
MQGRDFEAMRLYEQAIRSARENGFIHLEGVANGIAYHFRLSSPVTYRSYWEIAFNCSRCCSICF